MTRPRTTIPLVDLPDDLLTSYGTRGRTRGLDGRPLPERELLTVRQVRTSGAAPWRATPATVKAIVALDQGLQRKLGRRLRITETWRSPESSKRAHERHLAWIAAGRPPVTSTRYDERNMKAAWAAPPYRSQHNWGAALDFDVEAVCETDADLDTLWDIAAPLGFDPIIRQPNRLQSEAWHLDHLGPLERVADTLKGRIPTGELYGQIAMAGCALAGIVSGPTAQLAYVQARLLLGGKFCGRVDGVWGPLTRAALQELDIPANANTPSSHYIGALDAREWAFEELANA